MNLEASKRSVVPIAMSRGAQVGIEGEVECPLLAEEGEMREETIVDVQTTLEAEVGLGIGEIGADAMEGGAIREFVDLRAGDVVLTEELRKFRRDRTALFVIMERHIETQERLNCQTRGIVSTIEWSNDIVEVVEAELIKLDMFAGLSAVASGGMGKASTNTMGTLDIDTNRGRVADGRGIVERQSSSHIDINLLETPIFGGRRG